MNALNSEQVSELYTNVAKQITTLYQQSEAAGNDVAINSARTHFFALSGYLAENGVLDALNAHAHYLANPEAYTDFESGGLPIF
jgi:hypothetical protein